MPFEPKFGTVTTEKCKIDLVDKIKVDSRTDVLSESVKEVLNLSCKTVITDCNVVDGKITYTGKVCFFLSFLNPAGDIEKTECGAEFSGAITDSRISLSDKVNLDSVIEKAECGTSNVSLTVSSKITVKAKIIQYENKNILNGGQNLIIKNEDISIPKSLGYKCGFYPIEEEIELNYPIGEVLDQNVSAIVTSVQCGVGVIIVDGEVVFSTILLQSKEKKDIIKESKRVSFRTEIDCEEATPDCVATANVKEKSFKTDIVVDQEGKASKITFSVNLKVCAEAFTVENCSVASDVFSLTDNVETVKEECLIKKNIQLKNFDKTIAGRVEIKELPMGAFLSTVGNEKIEIVSVSVDKNCVKLVGYITCTVFFNGSEGIFSRRCELPFDESFDCNGQVNDVCAVVISSNAKMISLTELEIESAVKVSTGCYENEAVKSIIEVKCLGEKKANLNAISVYIALPNEDVWSLAKRINIAPENLIETNPELVFPLSGNERIAVYRKG